MWGAASRPAGAVLPVFPLGLVPLLYSDVPLRIFEARYRILFSTILHGTSVAAGLEEGLEQREAPWCGTRRFGMCFADERGQVARVGGILEVAQHEQLEDGQMLVTSKVVGRFQIEEVLEERPLLVCRVSELEEPDVDGDPEAQRLVGEVRDGLQKVVGLVSSLAGDEVPELPDELKELPPGEFSHWIPNWFPRDPQQQQALLEAQDVVARLKLEKEVFQETYNYHLARSALKNAFDGDSAEGTSEG